MDKKVRLATNRELQTKLTEYQRDIGVLRSDLQLVNAMLNAVDAIALVFDPKGHLISCNTSFEQITGYAHNEVTHQPFWDKFCNPNDRELVKRVFERIKQDKTAIAHAHEWITKDRSRRRIAWNYTPFFNDDGILKYAIAIGNDITQYQQQEELPRLQAVLKMDVQPNAIAKEQEPTAQKPVAELTQANEKLQQHDHTQKAILQAEQARSQELAKANEVLKKSLESLATEPSLDKFLGQVLGAIAAQFNSSLAEYWYHKKNTAFVGMMSWQGQTYNRAEISKLYPTHPGVDGFQVPPEMIHGEDLHHRKQHFITEDWLTDPFVKHVKWMSDNGLYKQINVPIVFGDECIGALIVRMSREHQITTGQIELAQTLAHQATLAAQLTRLAEEAKQAAIAREQEKAANERVAELAKANEALKNSLTLLADEPSLDKFLGYVLQTIADRFGDRSGAVYLYSKPHNTTLLHLNYENGHLQQGDRITHPAATLPQPPRAWDDQYLPVLRHNQLLIHHASEFESPAYAPYRQHYKDRGIQTTLIMPMMFGSRLLGSLTLRSTQHRNYTPEELELARALAQQATLAVQLTQLRRAAPPNCHFGRAQPLRP